MKRCPTCNKTYTDPVLSFCVDDGTPLVQDDEVTVVSPNEGDGDAVAYKPPSGYVPPGGTRNRRVWPWILGIVAAIVIGIAGLGIAAAVFIPRLLRSKQHDPVNLNANRDHDSSSGNVNSSSGNLNANSSSEGVRTPPPTDKEQVLAELTQLEHEWTVANLNADKKELDRILAVDYAGPAADGHLQGKAEYIRTIQRDTTVEKWNFENLQLNLRGERATLSGRIRLIIKGNEELLDFTDKFVWRDSRWQATGSEVTRSQNQ